MVLAHHSSLAYTTWAYFDKQNIFKSTAPIVDTTRWAFFDYAENFNDVFFMSLMFLRFGTVRISRAPQAWHSKIYPRSFFYG